MRLNRKHKITQEGDKVMRNFWNKCVCLVILEFVLVAAGLANTLTLGEQDEVLAETHRYRARFERGVLVHFHNKLTNETYTLPPQADSNEQSGISIQYNEGEYGRYILIDEHWEVVESKRLAPLSVEVAYYSDYRVDKTVRMRISIDAATGDLVIQQHGTSERVVSIMWGCGYLSSQQLDVIVPGNGGEIIDTTTEFNNKGFEYPKGLEAQLAILQGGDGGFFVRSTDTTFRFKGVAYKRSGEHFGIRFWTDNPAPFGEKKEITSVEWRLNTYRGDWQVPAEIYRNWMENAFQPKQPPAWVKDIKLVINLTNLKLDVLHLLPSYVDPSTTLIHLNGWEGPGWGEPDYNPKPEFSAFLEAAHGYGFRVMPRVNFLGCSPNHPLYPAFEKYQFRHPIRGHKLGYELNNPTYDSPAAYINPASKAFRKYVVAQLKKVYETYPVDAWHLDINHFIVNDANGLIDGLTPAEGNVLLHQELAEAMPGVVFGGESLHEVTSLHVNFAMRWYIPEGAQPHPISSFLFSPWTIPYAHTSVPNPDAPDADGQPERNQAIKEAYIVWNVLPTIRIRAPWMLEPYRIRTLGFLESIRNGQSWEQTWNIDITMDVDIVGDVNADGVVNVLDLVLVAGDFGVENPSHTDVNGDGVVNILDLVIVANAFE